MEKLSTVPMKTWMRPDAVGEPAPGVGAEDGADAGAHQHDGRRAEGELPRPDQEGEDEADQEVVEEFQRVADDGRGKDLDLVAGQPRPAGRVFSNMAALPCGACSLCSSRPSRPSHRRCQECCVCRGGARQARGVTQVLPRKNSGSMRATGWSPRGWRRDRFGEVPALPGCEAIGFRVREAIEHGDFADFRYPCRSRPWADR